MDCPKCSAANPDGAKFCKSCGENLAAAVAAAAETVVAPKRAPKRAAKPAAEAKPAPAVEASAAETAAPAKAPRKRTPKAATPVAAEASPAADPAVAAAPVEKPARKKAAPATKPAAAVAVEPIAVPPEGRSKTPLIVGGLIALALVAGGVVLMKHRSAEPEAQVKAEASAATPTPVAEQKAAEAPVPAVAAPAKEPVAAKPAPVKKPQPTAAPAQTDNRSSQAKKQVGSASPQTATATQDWQQALRNSLQECSRLGFFEKVACTEKTRWKYCAPNRWGTVPECPQSQPTNGG